MKDDYSKISPTGFFQAYYRTFYNIPYASEISDELQAKKMFKKFFGEDAEDRLRLVPIFEARYKGTDQAIQEYLRKTNASQILELASGMSPQGMIYTDRYPHLTYIETDLADMIRTKKEVVSKISKATRNGLHFLAANSLDPAQFDRAASELGEGPVLIFNIGFLSYLNFEEKKQLSKNIHRLLSRHGGVWITPDPAMHAQRRKDMNKAAPAQIRLEKKITESTGRNYDENSFNNEKDTDAFFESQGFTIEKYLPAGGYDLISQKNARLSDSQFKDILEHVNRYAKVWIMSVVV